MNDNISDMKKLFNSLDCKQESIQKASSEFIKIFIKDETRMQDLLNMWNFFCLNKSNKLAFIYLANDIIQNSFFQELKFHDFFLNTINDTFPKLYKIVGEKIRKEMIRMIEIWTERKIFDESKMENLKNFLSVSTIPKLDTFDNPLFDNYIKNNKIKVSDKIKEYAYNLDDFVKNEDKIFKLNEEKKGNTNSSKPTEVAEIKKLKTNQHKLREGLLRNSADLIKKQNQVYFKHVYYLQEVDKLLEKINSFKKINKKSNSEKDNSENNQNQKHYEEGSSYYQNSPVDINMIVD